MKNMEKDAAVSVNTIYIRSRNELKYTPAGSIGIEGACFILVLLPCSFRWCSCSKCNYVIWSPLKQSTRLNTQFNCYGDNDVGRL